jgi:hypothetical protein
VLLQLHAAVLKNLVDLDFRRIVVEIKVKVEELDPHDHKRYHDPREPDPTFLQPWERSLKIVLKFLRGESPAHHDSKNKAIEQLVQTMHAHFETIEGNHYTGTVHQQFKKLVQRALPF